MSAYQTTCEWFVQWLGAFRGHVQDALHHHINNVNTCCQKFSPEMFEKWNYSIVNKERPYVDA
jgi:hypothetical protein